MQVSVPCIQARRWRLPDTLHHLPLLHRPATAGRRAGPGCAHPALFDTQCRVSGIKWPHWCCAVWQRGECCTRRACGSDPTARHRQLVLLLPACWLAVLALCSTAKQLLAICRPILSEGRCDGLWHDPQTSARCRRNLSPWRIRHWCAAAGPFLKQGVHTGVHTALHGDTQSLADHDCSPHSHSKFCKQTSTLSSPTRLCSRHSGYICARLQCYACTLQVRGFTVKQVTALTFAACNEACFSHA